MEWTTKGRAHVLGDDILHDGGVIGFDAVLGRITDPEVLIPRLFAEVDPTRAARIRPGDFIVAGRNFLAGKAHNNGLFAFKALGLRILCESMGTRAFQGVVAMAIPCLTTCAGITRLVADGDEIEVDMLAGDVHNLTQGTQARYPGVADGVRDMVEQGGLRGVLLAHLASHPELAQAREAT
jgi:3-isopropylmalate/(R)-2-methylmalate dehydratase small subunit